MSRHIYPDRSDLTGEERGWREHHDRWGRVIVCPHCYGTGWAGSGQMGWMCSTCGDRIVGIQGTGRVVTRVVMESMTSKIAGPVPEWAEIGQEWPLLPNGKPYFWGGDEPPEHAKPWEPKRDLSRDPFDRQSSE